MTAKRFVTASPLLGSLIEQARAAKAAKTDTGSCSYQDLAAAIGDSKGHLHNMITGVRPLSPAALVKLEQALAPYLDLDRALLLAGYAPPALVAAEEEAVRLEHLSALDRAAAAVAPDMAALEEGYAHLRGRVQTLVTRLFGQAAASGTAVREGQ